MSKLEYLNLIKGDYLLLNASMDCPETIAYDIIELLIYHVYLR